MFPEKIEFGGEKYRTNSYNKVLDLIFQQTNELRGNKKKKEKEFLLSPTQYPDPVQATEIIGKQKNLSSLLSVICIFLNFSIFAIFCPFFVIKYTFSTL